MKNFSEFIVETTLKTGMVFKTTDKSGDLANQILFAKKVSGDQITIVTSDGIEADTTLSILNVDSKSIRSYDPRKDPKFK
jgi:hypothetical protein